MIDIDSLNESTAPAIALFFSHDYGFSREAFTEILLLDFFNTIGQKQTFASLRFNHRLLELGRQDMLSNDLLAIYYLLHALNRKTSFHSKF